MGINRRIVRAVRAGHKAINASGKEAYSKMSQKAKNRFNGIFWTLMAVIVWAIVIKMFF